GAGEVPPRGQLRGLVVDVRYAPQALRGRRRVGREVEVARVELHDDVAAVVVAAGDGEQRVLEDRAVQGRGREVGALQEGAVERHLGAGGGVGGEVAAQGGADQERVGEGHALGGRDTGHVEAGQVGPDELRAV